MAELPLQRLLQCSDELAKRWALALIASLPLARAEEVPLSDLARQGPGLVALVLRCVSSDTELSGLVSETGEDFALAARAGELAGAREPAGGAAAIETLRGVLWAEMIDQLDHPQTQVISDLASRLAHVCSLITIALLKRPPEPPSPAPWPKDTREPQIAVHDTRSAGPAAWITSIGRCLTDQADDGQPFAVELIEVIGIERLRHACQPGGLRQLIDDVQQALRSELRPGDILTAESDGRYWLVAPQTDGPGAVTLAERLITAVRSSVSHRGVPLEVAIGISSCPADGEEAAILAAQADTKLYGARAMGLSVIADVGDSQR
ncbi:MAG TPA: diguanylate cyclase [Solirubrobacteraceae bacterium]